MPKSSTPVLAVTGAAGFIGSYLVRKLLQQYPGAKIISVDSPEFFQERACCQDFKDRSTIISPTDFLGAISRLDPDAIFHMGACSNTEETRAEYIRETNLLYSQKLWRRAVEVEANFFYASSAGTYGMGEHGFSDDPADLEKFQPLSLYAQSKHDFDRWVLKQKPTPPHWAGFKFFNVYGPGEDHKGRQASMVLHLRKQILQGSVVKLYKSYKKEFADGEQARDFVYVGDLARVLMTFNEENLTNGIYNVGTGSARTFTDLAHSVATALGKKITIEFIEMPEKLKPQYQYWTLAELIRLRAAGYCSDFLNIEQGVAEYFKEWEFAAV